MEQKEHTAENWTMHKCTCGHDMCEDYFVSVTRSDGRVTKEQAELIIQAPKLASQLKEALNSYNLECKRNDELQAEVDRLKKTILESDTFKAYEARGEEILLYREALDKIANTIKWLQMDAEKSGGNLVGNMAMELSANPHYLKLIAVDALSKFQPKKDEATKI